jgi:hypothetical protein
MPLQIRRGTNAERLILASPLVSGELLWIVDDRRLYIGDGATLARDLVPVTGFNAEDAQDSAASLFTAGSHTGITFVYEDANDRVNATVDIPQLLQNLDLNNFSIIGSGNISITGDLSITGNITGDYKGSLFADDSTLLVNAIDGSINLDGTVKGDIVPDANETYDIGSNSNRFRDLYLSGTSLYLGSAQITASGAAVNLPAGSTINGVLISDIDSGVAPGSDYNINIVGDDSSSIINSSTRTVTASGGFFGNLTGNVTGNITGVVAGTAGSTLIGNVTGNTTGTHFGNVTGDVVGNLFGNVVGDLVGSVFGDDSTIIIDGNNNIVRTTNLTFAGTNISSNTNEVRIGSDTDDQQVIMYSGERNFFELYGTYDTISTLGPWIELRVSEGTMDSPSATNDQSLLSGLLCYGHDGTDYIQAGVLAFRVSGTTSAGAVPAELFVLCESDTIGSPSILSFTGNQGILTAPTIKPGVYADATARDAFLTSPAAGMMIFNTALQKFQGYVSDTGIAGGGAPNSTPGWINLN